MKFTRLLVTALTIAALAIVTVAAPAAAAKPSEYCPTERGVRTCTTTTSGTETRRDVLIFIPPTPYCGNEPGIFYDLITDYERPYTDTTTTKYRGNKIVSQNTQRTYDGDWQVTGTSDSYCHAGGA